MSEIQARQVQEVESEEDLGDEEVGMAEERDGDGEEDIVRYEM